MFSFSSSGVGSLPLAAIIAISYKAYSCSVNSSGCLVITEAFCYSSSCVC
jgi:hypothetical protein